MSKAAKAWAGTIGAMLTAVAAVAGAPAWLAFVAAALTGAAVYQIPNK